MFSKVVICLLLCITRLSFAVQYLPLPNGAFYPVQEGQSPKDAWLKAQEKYPEAFKLALPPEKTMDMDWYNDCIQKVSTSPNMSNSALGVAMGTCEYKAVPKKCRAFAITKAPNGKESGDARMRCVEECKNANYYSKSVGECSKG